MPDDQDPIEGDPIEGDLLDGETPEDAADQQPDATNPPADLPVEDDAAPAAGLDEQPEPPAAEPAPVVEAPASGETDEAAILAELSGIVGADAERLYGFGRTAGETVLVGVESVAASRGEFRAVSARIAEFSALEGEFAGSDHLSVEIRVALDEAEIYSIVAVAPLDELGGLFSIDMSPEQMADPDFARGQIEVVSGGLRELLDLSGLMLFSDELAGAEATLGEARMNAIDEAVAAMTDAAGEPMGLWIEFTLALPEEKSIRVVVVAPAGLAARLASLAPSGEDGLGEGDLGLPEPILGDATAPPFEMLVLPPIQEEELAVHPVRFPSLGAIDPLDQVPSSLDLIMDVSLRVTVELGRSTMKVEEVLALGPGSVVELNKLAGEPVDILINARPIARGEVVVVDENFGVRVTEILSPRSRIEAVGR